MKLLLVEDDEVVADALFPYLAKKCAVEVFADGLEAVRAFVPRRYEMALIDLGLPGIAGDEVARRMRAIDPSVVTVLVTGYALPADDARLSAFDFWYDKPVSADQIDDLMNKAKALRESRMERRAGG